MTKFVFHGGHTSARNKSNKDFFNEIINDLPKKPKILICLFAINQNRWKEEAGYVEKSFKANVENREFDFKLATIDDFEDQAKWADAIHFRGGDTNLLLKRLGEYPNIKEIIENKTISGSSAGAIALVENYYDQDHPGIYNKGLGIIGINAITHFESETYPDDYDKRTKVLEGKNGYELLVLRECEWKIFKTDN